MTEMGPPNVLLANIEFVVIMGPVMPVGPVIPVGPVGHVSLYGRIISRASDNSSFFIFLFLF
ncbi:hypothetical protein [Bacillus wiedmannii]|uniref:hypothetical protein n=1 Tax=Bacillus wiedmannii TaxID=1890302 RepID=UPI00210005AC|nr:hypothetical protein [Bacillus wiedmannii]